MQYGDFIAQNRSIQHDKSCPIIRRRVFEMLAHSVLSFYKGKLEIQRHKITAFFLTCANFYSILLQFLLKNIEYFTQKCRIIYSNCPLNPLLCYAFSMYDF